MPRRLGDALRDLAVLTHEGEINRRLDLRGVDPAALVEAASFHGLQATLHLASRDDRAFPAAAQGGLQEVYLDGIARHLRATSTLIATARALHGIRWLTFKGPVLVACYPRPDLRRYFDLDVLVHPADLGRAVRALEATGFTVLDRNWVLIDEQQIGEIHLISPDGVTLDLHHDLVYSHARRSRYSVSVSDALDRAVEVRLDACSYPTFSPEDAVLHLVLHASLSGAHRLGWLIDVDLTVRARQPDWQTLTARAAEWGLSLASHLVLHRCVLLLATPVPRPVLESLAPNPLWRLMVETSHRLCGVERVTGAQSWSRTLARVAVADLRTSVRLLGKGVVRALLRPDRHPTDLPTADDVMSLGYDAGGAARREAFFARLEAERSPRP